MSNHCAAYFLFTNSPYPRMKLCGEELLAQLKLPRTIQEAKTRHELGSLSLLGQAEGGVPRALLHHLVLYGLDGALLPALPRLPLLLPEGQGLTQGLPQNHRTELQGPRRHFQGEELQQHLQQQQQQHGRAEARGGRQKAVCSSSLSPRRTKVIERRKRRR
ncbi:uncharacterized protein LOC135098780 isoform X3 [Scylla paramamosain]|uniref:uncharacterized protein LOC135098780 isoform X3 n=1 Tax=Scylla paramamosain TaxID=85552 RepID=UPI0030837E1D